MNSLEVSSSLPLSLSPSLLLLPFLLNWNFIVSDILLERSQAEAAGGKLFGYIELLSVMGSDLYYSVSEYMPAFNVALDYNLSLLQGYLLPMVDSCREIVPFLWSQ